MRKTLAQLITEIDAKLPNNTIGAITPTVLRGALDDYITDVYNVASPYSLVNDYGLVCDGVTDNTAKMTIALADIFTNNRRVLVDPGLGFRLDGQAIFSIDTEDTLAGELYGSVAGGSKFICASFDGGIKIVKENINGATYIHMHDFMFEGAAGNVGTGLHIEHTIVPAGGKNHPEIILENLVWRNIGANSPGNPVFFDKCLYLKGWWRPRLTNLYAGKPESTGSAGTAWSDTWINYLGTASFHEQDCDGAQFLQCMSFGSWGGFLFTTDTGQSQEGGALIHCSASAVIQGIRISDSNYQPGFIALSGQYNSRDYNFNSIGPIYTGTAQAGNTSLIQLAADTPDEIAGGDLIRITAGTGYGQNRVVDAWFNVAKNATVTSPWDTIPDATSRYVVESMNIPGGRKNTRIFAAQLLNGANDARGGGGMGVAKPTDIYVPNGQDISVRMCEFNSGGVNLQASRRFVHIAGSFSVLRFTDNVMDGDAEYAIYNPLNGRKILEASNSYSGVIGQAFFNADYVNDSVFNNTGPRLMHSGGAPAAIAAAGTDTTPDITWTYICEVFVPATTPVHGIALLNGSAAAGNVNIGLANSAGSVFCSVAAAQAGTDAYQSFTFATANVAIGPGTYYIVVQFSNAAARFRTHIVGAFGAARMTTTVYGTFPAPITIPAAFTTARGPIASLF